MADPFLSEIRIMSFGFAPQGWALCNGQVLPINQNQALFSLLGTTYGGNGTTNFALPNLQGVVPMHMGGGHVLGETGGEQNHVLIPSEIPNHTHSVMASPTSSGTNAANPAGNVLAGANNLYGPPASLVAMHPGTIASVGSSQAHPNMQPFLTLAFCIALIGVFPSRN